MEALLAQKPRSTLTGVSSPSAAQAASRKLTRAS